MKGIKEWLPGWKRNKWMTGAKEPVKNRDLWEELDELLEKGGKDMSHLADVPRIASLGGISGGIGAKKPAVRKVAPSRALKIELNLIEGHAGVWGNERCDEIATSYADNKAMVDAGKKPLNMYSGPLTEYAAAEGISGGENILNITAVHQARKDAMKARKSASSSRGSVIGADGKARPVAAYSYVSMVGGKIHADKTWAECEQRVKGKSGARFRKVFSKDEENDLMKEFGKTGK